MRMHGITTAIDYAYLNVMDMQDPDNRNPIDIQAPMPNSNYTWSKRTTTLAYTANSPILLGAIQGELPSALLATLGLPTYRSPYHVESRLRPVESPTHRDP